MLIPHSRPSIDSEDIENVVQVLASSNLAQGEKVKEFENQTTRFIGAKYAVACSSGTAALQLALLTLDLEENDEIIIPSYVCASPYFATVHAGARPRIADINPNEANISAAAAKQRLSQKTKAIIVPHMFGNPAELDDLMKLGVPIIEDCAQSMGAEYKNRKVGSYGELAILSFYATKMITTGEGGMVLTNIEELYEKALDLRDYDHKPLVPAKYNYKMTDLQAALGISQLKKLPHFINCRKQIACAYTAALTGTNAILPAHHAHKNSVYYRYIILSDNAERVLKEAKEHGVICEKPVWKPLHQLTHSEECPNTDRVHEKAVSIPLYPSLSQEEIAHVTATLKSALKN
jgi:perosamine synthetase